MVFASHAKNLTTNQFTNLSLNIFRRDLLSNSTVLVSVDQTGNSSGDDDTGFYSVSSDGRYVAFASRAGNLVANDTNAAVDVFLRDVQAHRTRLITVDSSGNPTAASDPQFSSDPQVSADGRWVAFESKSTSLVDNLDDVGTPDVFIRDTLLSTTALVSVSTFGSGTPLYYSSYGPKMTSDGSLVLFISTRPDLVADGPTPGKPHLFLRDIQTSSTEWVTRDLEATLGYYSNGFQIVEHAISDNGQTVAFKVAVSPSAVWIFRYDTSNHSLLLLDTHSSARSPPQLSADGRFIAYESETNIFITDNVLGTTLLPAPPGSGVSRAPALSPDGHSIAFVSDGALVEGIPRGSFQIFWRDLIAQKTFLASVNTNGQPANASHELTLPAISADGFTVAFESSATDLVADDFNQASDVFVFNSLSNPQLICASVAAPAKPALTGPGEMTLARNCASADGRVIAFSGYDTSLARYDTNGNFDLFVHDFVAGTNRMITVGTNALIDAELSADGRYLTCTRLNRNAVDNYSDDILRFDLLTGTHDVLKGNTLTVLSSVPTTHSMSSDGRFVVFQSTATDLDPSDPTSDVDVFVHDFVLNTNVLLSVNNPYYPSSPSFAPDDQHIFFLSQGQLFIARSDQANAPFLVNHDPQSPSALLPTRASFAVSGNSQRVIFDTGGANGRDLYRNDLASNAVSLVCSNCQNGSLNGDGRWVAYESNNVSTPLRSVYLYDLDNATNQLVSTTDRLGVPSNAPLDSFSPVISRDSRFIVFLSRINVSPPPPTRLYVYDRSLDQVLLLTLGPDGIGLVTGSGAQLQFARDGRTLVFRSFSQLVKGDYNDKRDVFVLRLGSGDQDNDGLDDDWEMAYFNTLARDGSGDFDNDGHTDFEEFHSGTDPTNGDSVLRVLTVTQVGGSTTVFWRANPARSYRVEYKNAVDDTEWLRASGEVRFNGATGYIVDSSATAAAQRFYRAVVLP